MINTKPLIKFLFWILTLLLICLVGISNVFGATITDYATKYYYYSANDNSSTTSTDYRSGSSNRVTLDGATAPTYNNGEGFNGFYNRVNYSLTKGSIYTLSLTLSYNGVLSSEFSKNTINNRLLKTDFAHCSNCTITAVSGNIREYNSTNQAISGAKDYVVHMSYTFVATSSVSQFYIGSYTGDDKTFGLDNHQSTVVVIVASLDISNDNSSTIINQNDTIINQNNQIIEQNNQNTQNIIDNNTQNTQDIINNQNSNSEKEIESQKVCSTKYINKDNIITKNAFLEDTGILNTTGNHTGVTDYIEIDKDSKLTIIDVTNQSPQKRLCFYKKDKTTISCQPSITLQSNTNLPIPDDTYYVRFTIDYDLNIPTFKIYTCKSGNQALDDSINGLDNTLKDDNVDDNGVADAFESFNDYLDDNSTITQLITLPITLYTAILNSLNSSCSPFNLGKLYGEDLILPCINISQYLGNSLWTMIDIIISGFAVYAISKKMIKVFNNFSSLREGDVIDD